MWTKSGSGETGISYNTPVLCKNSWTRLFPIYRDGDSMRFRLDLLHDFDYSCNHTIIYSGIQVHTLPIVPCPDVFNRGSYRR